MLILKQVVDTNLPKEIQTQLKVRYDLFEKKQIQQKEIDFYIKQLRDERSIVKIQKIISCIDICLTDWKPKVIMQFEQSRIILYFFELARKRICTHLTTEIILILINIALNYQPLIQVIVENGGIQLFAELLQSEIDSIQCYAMDGLKIITRNSTLERDQILYSEVFDIILKSQTSDYYRKISCLSELCRGDPQPEYEKIKRCIEYFCQAILIESDTNITIQGLQALNQLKVIPGQQIVLSNFILRYKILNRIINLLDHQILFIKQQVLRIIETIVKGGTFGIDQVIQAGFLIKGSKLLQYLDDEVTEYTFRILSVIVTGSQQQMKSVIMNEWIFHYLFIYAGTKELSIVNVVASLLSNSISNCDLQDLQFLIEKGLFRIYKKILQSQVDQNILQIVLGGITSVLEKGNLFRENYYLIELKQLELDKLIQNRKDKFVMKIYNKYANLL